MHRTVSQSDLAHRLNFRWIVAGGSSAEHHLVNVQQESFIWLGSSGIAPGVISLQFPTEEMMRDQKLPHTASQWETTAFLRAGLGIQR